MYITYRGAKVNYIKTIGKGRTILFLHGWGGDTQSFLTFAKGHNAILLDFPPFGKSAEPKSPYTLEDYVIITQKILKKENQQLVDVVAHSFGARVAIWLAAKDTCVNKLILTGAAGLKPKFSLKKVLAKLRYKNAKRLVSLGLKDKKSLDKYGSSDYRALSLVMKKTFVNIVNFYQNDMLKDIKCATLLVWGKEDKETPLCFAKHIKKQLTDCGLVVWEGLGHFAYLQKAQHFGAIINNFFKD